MNRMCEECGRNTAQFTAIFNDHGQEVRKPVCEECYSKLQLSVDDTTKDLYHKLHDSTRKVLYYARKTAREKRHKYVLTAHLLYGILLEDGQASLTLESAGADVISLKTQLDIALTSIDDLLARGSEEEPILSDDIRGVLNDANYITEKLEFPEIEAVHLAVAITEDRGSELAKILKRKYNVDTTSLLRELEAQLPDSIDLVKKLKESTEKKSPLEKFSRNLNTLAKQDKLDPCIGRTEEIERAVHILSRRNKNNPVLVGNAGVGKTAIAEGMARKIVEADVPENLLNKQIYQLDLNAMLAGTRFRGDFEDRIKGVIDEVKERKDVILFIDELHTLMGAGGSGGGMDAANILKPELARGGLQCMGATTYEEYSEYIESDRALERRFQRIDVKEPTIEETKQIIKGIKERYEAFHKVEITEPSLSVAVDMSVKYISNRYLPDKAIDLMDEACAKVKLAALVIPEDIKVLKQEILTLQRSKGDSSKKEVELSKKLQELKSKRSTEVLLVTKKDIADVISKWTGIPVADLVAEEKERLLNLEDKLHEKVISQDQAITSLCDAIRRSRVGIKDPKRPIGSFIFAGKTGVGKSLIAKTLAEHLFGSKDHFLKLDMSEYMEKHTVSRLIGAPPGYVGFNQGGQLVEHVRKYPYSVILLDEIEKAHPDIFNVLLQIMEDGEITDGRGRKADLRNAIIIMTTNIGAQATKTQDFGFMKSTIAEDEYEKLKKRTEEIMKKHFKPEFLNRVDDIIVFQTLKEKDMLEIVGLMINELEERVKEHEYKLKVNEQVRKFLVEKGFDVEYGARSLRRFITKKIENPLAQAILRDKFKPKDTIYIKKEKEEILFDITQ